MRPQKTTKTTVFKIEDLKKTQPKNIEKEPEKVEEPKVKNKETPDLNVPKNSDIEADIPKKGENISEGIEKASKFSKAFKVTAILVAIGAAVAGAIYLIKNKNKQQGVKENAN